MYKSCLLLLVVFSLCLSANAQEGGMELACEIGINTEVLSKEPKEDEASIVRIISDCPLTYGRLEIYSRWGHILFKEKNTNIGFDGVVEGKRLAAGTYHYKIFYKMEGSRKTKESTGYFNII